jgi:NAD(P)-dependent dehydrogenase (short-subunit alcohol dehydrogenase family)
MKHIDYAGKTAVVTGAASGMGAEVTRELLELGAAVYALDVRPPSASVKSFVQTDLGDKASIDAAVASLPDAIDTVFGCAGVSGKGLPAIRTTTVNFVGHRHLVESLLPRMGEGGTVGLIASMGGMGWMRSLPAILPLLHTPGFDEAVGYLQAHADDPAVIGGPPETLRGYTFSKEALIVYAKFRAWQLAERRIRINTISPGATDTPMLPEFGPSGGAGSVSPIGIPSTPADQADALIYLNSAAASYVSGADLCVDYGFSGGIYTGQGSITGK